MIRISLLILVSFFLSNSSFGQNDSLNQIKYWKFRNNFVEKFIKIGPEQGESLPAGALVPAACIDNIASDGTDPSKYKYTEYGEMHWGDGMIRHGHYLALLATEYALKKKYDQDPIGTLNELYYALQAINRLDLVAESELNHDYGTSFEGVLNGFFLREDVPEDFCLNWADEPMKFRCTNSAFYENNNVAKLSDRTHDYYVKPHSSYQNGPSMDQMSSLMVGLLMIDKLVDNCLIQPKETDKELELLTEAKAITHRMVKYASDRNWELIDVNGWPVANGGGDLSASAYPYVMAAHKITGRPIETYAQHFYRRRLKFHPKYFDMQHCLTGFGTSGDLRQQAAACEKLKMGFFHPGMRSMYKKLTPGAIPGPLNNQNSSTYLDWSFSGNYHSINMSKPIWKNNFANNQTARSQSNRKEELEPGMRSLKGVKSYNLAIVFNLGIIAGHWESSMAHYFGNKTENRQLELTNVLLYDQVPQGSRELYRSYLDGMSVTGPFNIIGFNWTPNPEGPWYRKNLCGENGWGADFRWTESDQTLGQKDKEGIYSGLDYMLMHNLYYLVYADDLPEFKQTFDCFCDEKLSVKFSNTLDEEEKEAFKKLNSKLKSVPTCQSNVFESVFNRVNKEFDVEPLFDDYPELGIETVRYQTMDARIEAGGNLNIKSHFVIYSEKTLTVKKYGQLNTISGDIYLKNKAVIDLTGELRVGAGTKLMISSDAKLIMHPGARIVLEEGSQLHIEESGKLEFYNGAEIVTVGENVDMVIQGSIKMVDGGMFSVTRRAR
jgi:hypothetical protein